MTLNKVYVLLFDLFNIKFIMAYKYTQRLVTDLQVEDKNL